MTAVVMQALAAVGVRGLLGAAVAAVVVAPMAYHTGRWVEGVACEERIGRVLAERDLEMERAGNAVVDEALRARRDAVRDADRGGLHDDDGYRRD